MSEYNDLIAQAKGEYRASSGVWYNRGVTKGHPTNWLFTNNRYDSLGEDSDHAVLLAATDRNELDIKTLGVWSIYNAKGKTGNFSSTDALHHAGVIEAEYDRANRTMSDSELKRWTDARNTALNLALTTLPLHIMEKYDIKLPENDPNKPPKRTKLED
jgi:hypothetical protein